MIPISEPVDKALLAGELTEDKLIRYTRKGDNEIYEITAMDSPNVMREIGRLRELSFRAAGGGTGKEIDIDGFDTDKDSPYRQLIVWDPKAREIIGGYRYIFGGDITVDKLATSELFRFTDLFVNEYLPHTIELGRSFVQPMYQSTGSNRKAIFALDNLWDGLGALIMKYSSQCRYFFGKVTMYTAYNQEARNILLNFMHKYFNDNLHIVEAIEEIDIDQANPTYRDMFEGMDYKEAYRKLQHELKDRGEFIPPLINSYMNLSPTMKVFGTAVNRTFGDVEETAILVTIPDIFPDKLERYTSPLAEWRQRLKFSWWRVSESLRTKKTRQPRNQRERG